MYNSCEGNKRKLQFTKSKTTTRTDRRELTKYTMANFTASDFTASNFTASNFTASNFTTSNFTTSNFACPDKVESTTEERMRYFVSVCLAIIITVSIIGNSMVCIAFKVNEHLRTVSNSFILSLAVSDLITTIFVMPWDLDIMLKKDTWSYGEPFCKFYTTVYLLSAPASTLNLLAVSIDRYRVIRDPFAYKRQTTPFRAAMVIIFIWLYSTIMAFLPWMGWKDTTPWPSKTPPNCTVIRNTSNVCEFDIAWDYSIMMSVLNFVIPPLIMTVIYFKIFQIAKGHIRQIHRLESITLNGRASLTGMVNSANNSCRSSRAGSCSPAQLETHFNGNHTFLSPPHANDKFPHVNGKNGHANHKMKHADNKNKHASADIQHEKMNEHANVGSEHEKMISVHERKDSTHSNLEVTRRKSNVKRKSRTFSINGTSMLRKNVKAAKSLAIIVGTFFLCWYPFTIVSMAVNACVRSDLGCSLPPMYVERLLLIFGFLNSMLNPFLYALHNKEFKKTYKHILRWK